MTIPNYQTIMLPLLRFMGDGKERTIREVTEGLTQHFELTDDESNQLLPSGRQPMFNNRVGWASTYLKKAGLLEAPNRGRILITQRGRTALENNPTNIDVEFLKQYEEFQSFLAQTNDTNERGKQTDSSSEQTPEEILEHAHQTIRDDLANEILQYVLSMKPAAFEKLVIDVLVKMGYGGTRKNAGRAIGKTGDEGIDGIINEDRLGLDIIYIQAKRWQGVVSRPEIQKFAGALQGKRARKGIFITTSYFSQEARQYVSQIDNKIVLIDGELLANLIIDHNVGVSVVASYEIKRIDSDYFEEF
jgi:restriction system protein